MTLLLIQRLVQQKPTFGNKRRRIDYERPHMPAEIWRTIFYMGSHFPEKRAGTFKRFCLL